MSTKSVPAMRTRRRMGRPREGQACFRPSAQCFSETCWMHEFWDAIAWAMPPNAELIGGSVRVLESFDSLLGRPYFSIRWKYRLRLGPQDWARDDGPTMSRSTGDQLYGLPA